MKNYEPSHTLAQGLDAALDWYMRNLCGQSPRPSAKAISRPNKELLERPNRNVPGREKTAPSHETRWAIASSV
jgi:hypothetical protein